MAIEDAINTRARSSQLRITDLRIANLCGVPFRSSIVRIDTNQGITGYGEVRDGASKTYALMLKHRLVGENPCNVDKLFRMVKQFGHHAPPGRGRERGRDGPYGPGAGRPTMSRFMP